MYTRGKGTAYETLADLHRFHTSYLLRDCTLLKKKKKNPAFYFMLAKSSTLEDFIRHIWVKEKEAVVFKYISIINFISIDIYVYEHIRFYERLV